MIFNLPPKEETAKRLKYLNAITTSAQTKEIKKDIEWYSRNAKENQTTSPSWAKHCLLMADQLRVKLDNVY